MPFSFTAAFTSPINPPGATPVLSHAQVWKALVFKAEYPQRFGFEITDCEVVERRDTGLTRRVTFVAGMGPGMEGPQLEDVEFVGDMRVDFHMRSSGTRLQNVVSRGAGEYELFLTYAFEFVFAHIQEGSPEAAQMVAQISGGLTDIAAGGVVKMRKLAEKGEI